MISHHHRTIFVHIPKCGGQSIESAFLTDLGLTWARRAPLLLRPNNDPARGPARLAHLIARDYAGLGHIEPARFAEYFSFALTRCPFARVISTYNYLNLPMPLDRFICDWLPAQMQPGTVHYYFMRPQVDFITDADGMIMVNMIARLEDLSHALPTIRQRSNLAAAVPHANRSKQPRARTNDLTPDQIATIRDLYDADFALLRFTPEPV